MLVPVFLARERAFSPLTVISAAEGSRALGGPTGDRTAMPCEAPGTGGSSLPRPSSGGLGENGGEALMKAPRPRGRPGAPSNERPRRERETATAGKRSGRLGCLTATGGGGWRALTPGGSGARWVTAAGRLFTHNGLICHRPRGLRVV